VFGGSSLFIEYNYMEEKRMTLWGVIKAVIMIAILPLNFFYAKRHIERCDKYRKYYPRQYHNTEGFKKTDIVLCSINFIILLLLLLVAFPQLKFFSTNKFVCMIVFFIGEIISSEVYYRFGGTLDIDYSAENELLLDVHIAGTLFRLLVIFAFVFQSCTGKYIYEPKVIKEELVSKERIELEEYGGKKITHVKDTDEYCFIIIKSGMKYIHVDKFDGDSVFESDETYILVTTKQTVYVNSEYDKDSPLYYTQKTERKNELYYDVNDMIEVVRGDA